MLGMSIFTDIPKEFKKENSKKPSLLKMTVREYLTDVVGFKGENDTKLTDEELIDAVKLYHNQVQWVLNNKMLLIGNSGEYNVYIINSTPVEIMDSMVYIDSLTLEEAVKRGLLPQYIPNEAYVQPQPLLPQYHYQPNMGYNQYHHGYIPKYSPDQLKILNQQHFETQQQILSQAYTNKSLTMWNIKLRADDEIYRIMGPETYKLRAGELSQEEYDKKYKETKEKMYSVCGLDKPIIVSYNVEFDGMVQVLYGNNNNPNTLQSDFSILKVFNSCDGVINNVNSITAKTKREETKLKEEARLKGINKITMYLIMLAIAKDSDKYNHLDYLKLIDKDKGYGLDKIIEINSGCKFLNKVLVTNDKESEYRAIAAIKSNLSIKEEASIRKGIQTSKKMNNTRAEDCYEFTPEMNKEVSEFINKFLKESDKPVKEEK